MTKISYYSKIKPVTGRLSTADHTLRPTAWVLYEAFVCYPYFFHDSALSAHSITSISSTIPFLP